MSNSPNPPIPPYDPMTDPRAGLQRIYKSMRDEWGHLRDAALANAGPPDLPVYRVVVLDADLVRRVDELAADGDRIRGDLPFKERTVVQIDGHDAFALEPAEPGAAKDMTWPMYLAIVAAHGKPRTTRVRGEHVEAARAHAMAASRQMPSTPLAKWPGRAEDVARCVPILDRCEGSFLVSAAVVVPILGGAAAGCQLPDQTLWAGEDAARLDEERRQAERAAAEQQATVAAAIAEETRPRSWSEYGVDWVVRVPKGRPFVIAREPAYGVPCLGEDEGEDAGLYYGGPCSIPGLEVPTFSDPSGVSSISVDSVAAPKLAGMLERDASRRERERRDTLLPTIEAVGFVRELRARFGKLDVGPIPLDRFGDRGLPIAHELLAKWARRAFLNPGIAHLWLAPHLMNLIVAGALVRPDRAVLLTLEHLDGLWKRDHRDVTVPGSSVAEGDLQRWRPQLEALPPEQQWAKLEELRNAAMSGERPRDGDGNVFAGSWKKIAAHDAGKLPSQHARGEIEALAVKAAGQREAGGVGIGELLEEVAPAPTAKPKSRKGG